jgi:hypothetical protein
MTAFPGIVADIIPLPPRGITVSYCRIGERVITQWMYLCTERDDCYALATSEVSEEAARNAVARHTCPAPYLRSRVPSGKSGSEKMWDTLDDAIDALHAGKMFWTYEGDAVRAICVTMAECISIWNHCVPRMQQQDVLREAQRRWRMRQGEIPYAPTPGYRMLQPHLLNDDSRDLLPGAVEPKPVKATPAKRTTRPSSLGTPIPRVWSAKEVGAIKYAMTMMDVGEVAGMFNATEDEIRKVIA